MKRVICPEIGNAGVVSVRYQLLLCFLEYKHFLRWVSSGYEKLFSVSSAENSGEHRSSPHLNYYNGWCLPVTSVVGIMSLNDPHGTEYVRLRNGNTVVSRSLKASAHSKVVEKELLSALAACREQTFCYRHTDLTAQQEQLRCLFK